MVNFTYEDLLALNHPSEMGPDEMVICVGRLIDMAGERNDINGLAHGIALAEKILADSPSGHVKTFANYCRGNAYSLRRQITRRGTPSDWEWQHGDLEQEIISLRNAAISSAGQPLNPQFVCQIHTNLANSLNHVGRFVDAIPQWNRALAIDGSFGMALGNKGLGYKNYAMALYDEGHARVFLHEAQKCLTMALGTNLEDDAKRVFQDATAKIRKFASPDIESLLKQDYPLGTTKAEREYRLWCLTNGLFLNPLNDLGFCTIAARDVFSVPPIVVRIGEGPSLQGFFNQMKQEYVAARFLFYEGTTATRPHFSDRQVLLLDTLDYPSYSLAVEKQKLAFRAGYSILDKVAFFLNDYMLLGIPEKNVSFRTIWFEKQQKSKGLWPGFKALENWPLRGLFWLAKDMHESEPGFREAIDPEGRSLSDMRHHIEHKYLKVHEDFWHGPSASSGAGGRLCDRLAHSVYRSQLADRVLLMLRLARAALIYLSLGVWCEERRRAKERGPDKIIGSMPTWTWKDEWKF